MTLGEFVDEFIRHKEEGKPVEKSTVNDYRKEARVLKRYLGDDGRGGARDAEEAAR